MFVYEFKIIVNNKISYDIQSHDFDPVYHSLKFYVDKINKRMFDDINNVLSDFNIDRINSKKEIYSKKFKNTNMIYNISVCEKSNIKYVVTSIKTVQCKMHLVLTYENVQKPKKIQNKLNMPLQRMMGKLRKI
jgi:hypothetical protein